MISTSDRQDAVQLIDEARAVGARLQAACAELGIGTNTYRRWVQGDQDRRPQAVRPVPRHTLSPEERQQVLEICHRPEFASLPPGQIVPRLLDEEGLYVASESSYYRILREHGEQHHRGRARVPRPKGDPQRHRVTRPNACWSWDVTYLPTQVRGQFYYLYMIIDIYSRKIVGWEIDTRESSLLLSRVLEQAVLKEGCINQPLVLHSDNGSPFKGETLRAKLKSLDIEPSYSRPRVSNDNPFSESIFATCKGMPSYPENGFESLEAARQWVHAFAVWYNTEHRHSRINYVTPEQRHNGEDIAILAQRQAVYAEAKARNPRRWSRQVRDWTPAGAVWLNPDKERPESGLKKVA